MVGQNRIYDAMTFVREMNLFPSAITMAGRAFDQTVGRDPSPHAVGGGIASPADIIAYTDIRIGDDYGPLALQPDWFLSSPLCLCRAYNARRRFIDSG